MEEKIVSELMGVKSERPTATATFPLLLECPVMRIGRDPGNDMEKKTGLAYGSNASAAASGSQP